MDKEGLDKRSLDKRSLDKRSLDGGSVNSGSLGSGSRDSGSHWRIDRSEGPAGPFHDRVIKRAIQQGLGSSEGAVWIHRVLSTALVLGSTQDESVIDHKAAAAAGVEVARRRSGGGLVLIEPGFSCWIDLVIGRDHPQWDDDIGRAFHWVGKTWLQALTQCGIEGAVMHTGVPIDRDNGRFLCFAGLGSGEITVSTSNPATTDPPDKQPPRSKIVGLSQRRTRDGARFQGLLVARHNSTLLERLVSKTSWPPSLGPDSNAIGLPPASSQDPSPLTVNPEQLEAAFIAALPR